MIGNHFTNHTVSRPDIPKRQRQATVQSYGQGVPRSGTIGKVCRGESQPGLDQLGHLTAEVIVSPSISKDNELIAQVSEDSLRGQRNPRAPARLAHGPHSRRVTPFYHMVSFEITMPCETSQSPKCSCCVAPFTQGA